MTDALRTQTSERQFRVGLRGKAPSPPELNRAFGVTRREAFRLIPALGIAAVAAPAQDQTAPPRIPEAPPGASARTKENIGRMRLDIPAVVQVSHSISYRLATRQDADSRRLDVYRNQYHRKAPVLIFFHGGAWRSGHRRQYIPLGVSLALGSATCVIPSFSQAPRYQFPEPVKDGAAVVRWVYDNIANFGGDREKIFLGGHSSGVQIAALLALDRRYLDFHFLQPKVIRGVVAISGLYAISSGFEYAFGDSPALWAEASPMQYVHPGAPPFLVVSGSDEAPSVKAQSEAFIAALSADGVPMETKVYPGEDHSSMIALASIRDSALQESIRSFIRDRSG